VPDAAIASFRRLRKLKLEECTCRNHQCDVCREHLKHYAIVAHELNLRPWEWLWHHDPALVDRLTRAADEE